MKDKIKATAKDISEIYAKDTWIPKWLAYSFWYIILKISFSSKGVGNGKKK